ncbi:hypothetical protein [Mycobacterium lepromatosis]|uniref:hypothetical protein n=1 Tax=Mycobacterium lepromatosis TaxID=480418 RepID=UPI000AC39584|nr:hypothetical protein [Mycobacterium lepromatosis]
MPNQSSSSPTTTALRSASSSFVGRRAAGPSLMTHMIPGTVVFVHASMVKVAGDFGEDYWPHNTSARSRSSS